LIIIEHHPGEYILRKMIHACTGVVARAFEHEGEVDGLLDEVERDILRISEERVETTANSMKELVRQASNHRRLSPKAGDPDG